MLRIIMHGCNGKLGQVIGAMIKGEPDIEIVAGIDIQHTITYPFPVYMTINDCDMSADMIIDFSTASVVPAVLKYANDKKIPVVICTTGLSKEIQNQIKDVAKAIPIFFSANMSIGVNLIINLAKKATAILANANFDIEIVEKHHNQKLDAPSGTALSIADAVNETLDNEYAYKYDRSKDHQKRPQKEIGIHSVRGGTIVGEHDIIFAGRDEIIEIRHSAMSREIFATGAIKAIKYLTTKPAGLYDMGDLIEEL